MLVFNSALFDSKHVFNRGFSYKEKWGKYIGKSSEIDSSTLFAFCQTFMNTH